jgi:four helix bundle protein
MDSEELKKRTRQFALNIIKLVEDFPKTKAGDVIGRQLVKSATSIGANYRSACRAQSHAHFISKISIVEEEADESLYWLELALASGLVEAKRLSNLIDEADELTAIFTSSRHTARKRR